MGKSLLNSILVVTIHSAFVDWTTRIGFSKDFSARLIGGCMRIFQRRLRFGFADRERTKNAYAKKTIKCSSFRKILVDKICYQNSFLIIPAWLIIFITFPSVFIFQLIFRPVLMWSAKDKRSGLLPWKQPGMRLYLRYKICTDRWSYLIRRKTVPLRSTYLSHSIWQTVHFKTQRHVFKGEFEAVFWHWINMVRQAQFFENSSI
jgi:hypothetical protein